MVTTTIRSQHPRDTLIDLGPRSTYEVITREKLEHMADDLAEIRHRVNTIFYLIISSVLVNIVLRFLP